MNEAPKEYDQIKKLIENKENNDLKMFSSNSFINVDKKVKLFPHKKK